MEPYKNAWEIVKLNIGAWVILGLVYLVVASVGVGIFLMPNLMRATRNALEKNQAPEMGELFNFDHIAEDFMAMLFYSVAIFVGSLACGVGAYVAAVLFIWVPMLAAEGRFEPMDAMKVSMAHAKTMIAPIAIFLIIGSLINSVGATLCVVPMLVTLPMFFIAMWKFYRENEAAIFQAANEAGISPKA